jgi:hypothetical protein
VIPAILAMGAVTEEKNKAIASIEGRIEIAKTKPINRMNTASFANLSPYCCAANRSPSMRCR